MMRAARDAKRGLDPRAELNVYLDDDKHRGRISPETFGTIQFVKTYYMKDLRHQEVASKRATDDANRATS